MERPSILLKSCENFGIPRFRLVRSARKLVQQGNPSLLLGYGVFETAVCAWYMSNSKWTRAPLFRFDSMFSRIPSYFISRSIAETLWALSNYRRQRNCMWAFLINHAIQLLVSIWPFLWSINRPRWLLLWRTLSHTTFPFFIMLLQGTHGES